MNWLQWAPLAIDAAVILLLVGVTIFGGDLWPFSSYPMFARYMVGRSYQSGFVVSFHFSGGRVVEPTPRCEGLVAAFQRDFSQAWQNPARQQMAQAVVARFWKDVGEYEPALKNARRLEVKLLAIQIGARKGLSVAERSVGFYEAPWGHG